MRRWGGGVLGNGFKGQTKHFKNQQANRSSLKSKSNMSSYSTEATGRIVQARCMLGNVVGRALQRELV